MNGEIRKKKEKNQIIPIIKMPRKDQESEESGKESKPPCSREQLENVLNPIY